MMDKIKRNTYDTLKSKSKNLFGAFFKNDKQVSFVKLYLTGLIFISVFGGFIANNKPLYCKIDGKSYFPAFKEVMVDLGISKWQKEFFSGSWEEYNYQKKIMPLIPYSSNSIDVNNMKVLPPFANGRNESFRYRHFLGTDSLGRDVLAGMIDGTRIALLIGLGSMALATLFGAFIGLMAGFYGDHGLKLSLLALILFIGIFISWTYFIYTSFLISSNTGQVHSVISILIITSIHFLFAYLTLKFSNYLGLAKKIRIPLDILVMRFIEIFKTIPALILLLAMLVIVSRPSLLSLTMILAFLLWPSVARYSRAEMLRIREEDYIKSSKVLGLSDLTIILKHALPNAIGPIMVVVAFGISTAILLEATLSFLGLGLAFDEVTWGSMLSDARKNFSAWWLALFPGIAIFLTILSFNIVGDRLQSMLKGE